MGLVHVVLHHAMPVSMAVCPRVCPRFVLLAHSTAEAARLMFCMRPFWNSGSLNPIIT
ncbi:MAG: hypothetical protein ACI3ZG_00795 [Candidatus Coprenecus sp.]